MRAIFRKFFLSCSPLLAFLAGGCGSSDSAQVSAVVVGNPDDPFEKGVRLSTAGQLVRASVAEGLVAFDAQGRVVPALADRWIVTDDGRSYIFRLRDGTWRDGSELTARSARLALNSAVKALKGTSLALDLDGVEEIREMAGRVVEIRLAYAMPHLLQLLAQPELGLTNKGQGAGPMTLEREEDMAVLTPIPPDELGLPEIESWSDRVRSIGLSAMSGEDAVARFNNGEADLVLGGRVADFPRTASVGILRGTIQLDPVDGLFGLLVAAPKGFLGEAANREALAMAIDREALIKPFGVSGWETTTRIVPQEIEGDIGGAAERWAGMTIEDRRAIATARVSNWRSAGGEGKPVKIAVWLPEGPGGDILFKRLSEDFGVVGVTLSRAESLKSADLRLVDSVARYPRPLWFLHRLSCQLREGMCSRDADAKLAEARKVTDPVQSAALVREAEALLTEANVFLPFGTPMRWSLVRGNAIGFETNRWGWHPLMPMALLPK